MLADSVVATLRLKVPRGSYQPARASSRSSATSDLMGKLVPGIVPLNRDQKDRAPAPSVPESGFDTKGAACT